MNTRYIVLFIVGLFVATSCQKVIDVNLNEADPILSIDAVYNATDEVIRVKLGLSSNYFSNEQSAPIDAATVIIKDENGIETNIPNIGDGVYLLESYTPAFNTTYTLTVEYDGTTYTANSLLQDVIPLDDLSNEFVEESLFGEEGYVVFMELTNDVNKDLYFRAIPFLSDTIYYEADDLFLFDNEIVADGFTQVPFFTDRFQIGDTVDVELRSYNLETYNYYNEIAVILSGQSAAPTNPTTNWDNDALGFFQTWGYSKEREIIQ